MMIIAAVVVIVVAIGDTLGGPLHKVPNGVLQCTAPNVGAVLVRFACSRSSAAARFVSRFVEIRVGDENESLNADQDL